MEYDREKDPMLRDAGYGPGPTYVQRDTDAERLAYERGQREMRLATLPLIEASKNLLEACYQADAIEELSECIDGSLLDAVRNALINIPITSKDEEK
jgi:hypothetical protein